MNKKFIFLILALILATVIVSAFLIVQDSDKSNNIVNNNSSSNINESLNKSEDNKNDIILTNHKGNTDENNVIITANCQKIAYQGTNAVIVWKITNNGNKTIKNVKASDQIGDRDFGDIQPSQTKTYKFTINIPTNNDLKLDFGMENGQWPGPLWIGGFGVSYSIDNETFSSQSNSMEIQIKI